MILTSKYILIHGQIYDVDELYHHGVKGMKWGVRKSEYKSMTRKQKKALKDAYFETDAGKADLKKITRNTTIATVLGGPLVGIPVGFATLKRIGDNVPPSESDPKVSNGSTACSAVMSKIGSKTVRTVANANKTESKKIASLKERVTGKKEDGKPAFLMSEKELSDFRNKYIARRDTLIKRYHNASNASTKAKISEEIDQMENDYLSVVEQDFWYSDD